MISAFPLLFTITLVFATELKKSNERSNNDFRVGVTSDRSSNVAQLHDTIRPSSDREEERRRTGERSPEAEIDPRRGTTGVIPSFKNRTIVSRTTNRIAE